MSQVIMFEDEYDGDFYMEWKPTSGGICWHHFNVRKLSRQQFKRLILLILGSGQWYIDWQLTYDGEDTYATLTPGRDSRPLSAMAVVRWMWSIRHV